MAALQFLLSGVPPEQESGWAESMQVSCLGIHPLMDLAAKMASSASASDITEHLKALPAAVGALSEQVPAPPTKSSSPMAAGGS